MTKTNYDNVDPHKPAKVVAWTHNPRPKDAIQGYLRDCNRDELLSLIEDFPGAAAKLAWLELGVRNKIIPTLVLDVVEVLGDITINAKIDAPAIVENIVLSYGGEDGD